MAINVIIVLYNGGFLPDILLLTQAPICVWFDGKSIVYYCYPLNYVLQGLLFCYVWWLCMTINIIQCRGLVFTFYEAVYYYSHV